MLFNIIPQLIIILALVGIVIVFSRKNFLVVKKLKQIQAYFPIIKSQIFNFVNSAKTRIQKQIQKQKKKATIKKQEKSAVQAMIEEQKYIQIISQDPKNIFAYQKLGQLYLQQKNYGDAQAAFKQILKIEPKNSKAKDHLNKLPK